MALQIIRNNIINVEADAIVNTANPAVRVGRGVDHAIYEAAGWDRLLKARAEIGDMSPGEAAWTPAFDLHAKYIIHTVGPAWRGGGFGERETVAQCYRRSLGLAAELGCESIAFPLIATGTYGFPKDEALRIAISEISGFLLENEMEVLLVVYDKESFEVSGKLFSDIRSFIEDREAVYDAAPRAGNRRSMALDSMPVTGSGRRSFRELFRKEKKAIGTTTVEETAEGTSAAEETAERITEAEAKAEGTPETEQTAEEKSVKISAPVSSDEYRGFIEERTLMSGAPLIDEDYDLLLDEEASAYDSSYEEIPGEEPVLSEMFETSKPHSPVFPTEKQSLEDRLWHLDKTFQEYLFMLIDRRGLTDPEVYKKANIDRKHFSKIRSNVDYTPSKKTALALALALELSLDETKDLLARAGLALSPSMMFDRIIEYCIETSNYDIYEINCILFKYEQPTLGA